MLWLSSKGVVCANARARVGVHYVWYLFFLFATVRVRGPGWCVMRARRFGEEPLCGAATGLPVAIQKGLY